MTNGVKDQWSPLNEATSDFSQSNFRVTVGERQEPVQGERHEDVDSTEANYLSGTVAGRARTSGGGWGEGAQAKQGAGFPVKFWFYEHSLQSWVDVSGSPRACSTHGGLRTLSMLMGSEK